MAAKVLIFTAIFVVLKINAIQQKNVDGVSFQGHFDSLTLLAVLKIIVRKLHIQSFFCFS